MLGVYLSVPIACFRSGLAREYLESEPLPPPSTCYGFLLSLIGETRRQRHIGCRICPALITTPECSTVVRTVWRVKKKPAALPENSRPDFQQLLTNVRLVVWLDSRGEAVASNHWLEKRVADTLAMPARTSRFGALALGESTHLVDEVGFVEHWRNRVNIETSQRFVLHPYGELTLPVWVDHVSSSGTRYTRGTLEPKPDLAPPAPERMPCIEPPQPNV